MYIYIYIYGREGYPGSKELSRSSSHSGAFISSASKLLINFRCVRSLLALIDSEPSGQFGEGIHSHLCVLETKHYGPGPLSPLPPFSSREIKEGSNIKQFGILFEVLQGGRKCWKRKQSWWQEKRDNEFDFSLCALPLLPAPRWQYGNIVLPSLNYGELTSCSALTWPLRITSDQHRHLSLPSWNPQASGRDRDSSKQSHRLTCICKYGECNARSKGQLQGTKLDPEGDSLKKCGWSWD